MTKQKNKHFLIVVLTVLKLYDNTLENPFIFHRCADLENSFFIRKSILTQDIFYIATCKMNPVYFCLIFSIIFIFLKFLRSVQHNIAGGNNRFVIYIVKMKMPTTSSDIDDLIIQASLWTVGWQFWIAGKAISATASYNQWTTFVFEIHVGVIQITSIHIHRAAPLFTLFIIVSFSAYFIQSNS